MCNLITTSCSMSSKNLNITAFKSHGQQKTIYENINWKTRCLNFKGKWKSLFQMWKICKKNKKKKERNL